MSLAGPQETLSPRHISQKKTRGVPVHEAPSRASTRSRDSARRAWEDWSSPTWEILSSRCANRMFAPRLLPEIASETTARMGGFYPCTRPLTCKGRPHPLHGTFVSNLTSHRNAPIILRRLPLRFSLFTRRDASSTVLPLIISYYLQLDMLGCRRDRRVANRRTAQL